MGFGALGRSIAVVLVASAAAAASAHAQLPPVPTVEPPALPPVPTVETPAVPQLPAVPDVPDLPAPVPVPALPDPPAVRVPDGGGTPTAEDGTAPRGGSGGPGASGGAGAMPGGATSAASGGGRSEATTRRRSRATTAPSRRAVRPTPRERRLRRTVARLSGCLAALRPGQRRVLILRAGVGAADPHSRAAVAERLDVTLRTVRRAERRGIRALRAAADAGCRTAPARSSSMGGGGDHTVDTVAFQVGTGRDQGGGGTTGTATGRADEPGQGGVKEAFRSGPGGAPGATLTPPSLGGGAGGPPLVALLGLAFLAGFAAVWTFERRGRPGR